MNFVIFPVFFLSGALYPAQTLPTVLKQVARLNPFTYGVDFLKHAILPASTVHDFSVTLPAFEPVADIRDKIADNVTTRAVLCRSRDAMRSR